MLSIAINQISGEIPSTIGNLVNLVSWNAGYNQLEGEIPESIGNLTNLDRLWLNFNNLSGEVPSSICNLNTLNWSPYGFEGEDSYLNNNQLCPPYPGCIEENIGYQDTSECSDLGDLNGDGQLNILDLVTLANLILAEAYDEIADFNEDEQLNILDIVILVNIILVI